MSISFLRLATCIILSVSHTTAFYFPPVLVSIRKPTFELQHDHKVRSTHLDAKASDDFSSVASTQNLNKAADLKRQLYQLAASYDRGFSATPKARTDASDIIQQLSALNPTTDASNGIDGDSYDDVPLRAIWRMIWTSALDVVSLAASPFAGECAKSTLFCTIYLHMSNIQHCCFLYSIFSTKCYISGINRPSNRHKCD